MSIVTGTVIGQYRVLSLIGEGGMGAVYRAEHLVLGRNAAIKVLLPHIAREEVLVRRFLNEARIAANLRHRNIVDVLDCGTFSLPDASDGQWYIALEYLEGKSLGTFIGEHGGNPIDIATIVHVIGEAANGLHAAHERHQLVHRDVKPDNLYVIQTEDDPLRVKVLDFGIAKLRAQANGVETRSQTVMGTPAYAAPEQLRDSKEVDARADVWALGVITHEMITGVRPWGATTSVWEIISRQAALKKAPDPREFRPDTPERVAEVISRAMEPDPNRRWQSAKEYACALAEAGTMPYSVNCMAILERYAPELARASSQSVTVGRPIAEPIRAAPPELVTARDRPKLGAQPDRPGGAAPPTSPAAIEPARPISTLAASAGQSVAPVAPRRGRGSILALAAVGVVAIGIIATIMMTRDSRSAAESAGREQLTAATAVDAASARPDSSSALSPLAVVTSPEGAHVFLDGADKGRAPLSLDLPVGTKVVLRAEMPGYVSMTRSLTIDATRSTFHIDLIPQLDPATTTPDAMPPAKGPPVKEPDKRRSGPHDRNGERRRTGSGGGSNGSSSDPGFSPNDVL